MRVFLIALLLLLSPSFLWAQLAGNYTIGSTQTYTSIASIITDLNTKGVSGPVSVLIPANYVETTPSGGFSLGSTVLNGSLSSTNTLTFTKTGSGHNPLVYGAAGQYATRKLGGLSDVIWALNGCDYVTIDGIDLCDSTINTTLATANEIGYGFFKLNSIAPFDGCQHNLIQHCSIRLQSYTINGAYDIKSAGIYFYNKTRSGGKITSLQTGMNLTSVSDAHSYNQVYTNTIIGPYIGVLLVGTFSNLNYWDEGNDIGGYSPSTGNFIYSYGNDTLSSGVFVKSGVSNINISNNVISNTQLASPSMSASYSGYMTGIYADVPTPLVKASQGLQINNNTIDVGLATSLLSFTTALHCDGIKIDYNGDIHIDSNQVDLHAPNVIGNNGVYCNGIKIELTDTNSLIHVQGNMIGGLIKCDDFRGITINPFPGFKSITLIDNNVHTSANSSSIYNAFEVGNSGAADFINVCRNSVSSLQLGLLNSSFIGFKIVAGGSRLLLVDSNQVANITANAVIGIGLSYDNVDTVFIKNNSLMSLSANASLIGVKDQVGNSSNSVAIVHNNILRDLKALAGASTLIGYNRINSSGTFYFFNNNCFNINSDFFSSPASVFGLACFGNNLTSNKRYSIFNNVISVGNSISGLSSKSSLLNIGSICFYGSKHTKIDLINNSLTVFGSLHNRKAISANLLANCDDTLYFANNIFANYSDFHVSFPTGTIADLIVDSASQLIIADSSDNNAYYLKSLHQSRVYIAKVKNNFYDSLVAFQNGLYPAETSSFYEDFPFISSDYTSPGFMQFSSLVMTQCESGGSVYLPLALYNDIVGNKRFGAPGYSGTGTSIDVGAYELSCSAYMNPLVINSVQVTPLVNACNAIPRTVTCSLTVANGFVLSSVNLKYSWNGLAQGPISMTYTGNNIWSCVLPASIPSTAMVDLYIEVSLSNGNIYRSSAFTFQDAVFVNKTFEILGRRNFGCSSSSTSYTVLDLGDSSSTMPRGYGNAYASSSLQSDILNVSLTGFKSAINNSSSFSTTGGGASNGLLASILGSYSNYTNTVSCVNLREGYAYPISVTVAAPAGGGPIFGALDVYLDLNRNGKFDLPNEKLFFVPYGPLSSGSFISDSATFSGLIQIPTSIPAVGKTLMRVTYRQTSFIPDGESFYNLGETEDYIVNLCKLAPASLNYVWTDNGNAIGGNSNVLNFQSGQSGYHILQVLLTDSNNCQSSDTANVYVNAPANIQLNPTTISSLCKSDSVIMTVSYPGSVPQLSWYNNNTLIQNVSATQFVAHQAGSYFVIYNNGFCTDTSNHVLVSYYPSPPLSYNAIIAPSDTICQGDAVSITISGLTGMNWSPMYTNGSIISPVNSTTFIVNGSDANNCFYRDSFNIHVDTLPSHVIISGNPIINYLSPFYYAVNSSIGQSCQWIIDGGSILNGQGSNSIAVMWTSGAPDYYLAVVVTNSSGCRDTFSLALNFSDGINQLISPEILLLPNPAYDNIRFQLTLSKGKILPYRIENVLGQCVWSGQYNGGVQEVDVQNWADGIYYLKVDPYRIPFVVGH